MSKAGEPPWFTMWTVYENPSDYPGKFVVRRWENNKPAPLATVHDSLQAARESLPPGMCQLGRMPGDDPCIVEVWF